MNRHHLENFIQDNRKEFDSELPSPNIWANIESALDNKKEKIVDIAPKTKRRFMWPSIAAAAVVLVLLSVGIKSFVPNAATSVINDELAQTEAYYQQEVEKKYGQLAKYSYDNTIDLDLAQIDQFVNELKTELEHAPQGAEKEIISNLIKSYETKLSILEKVLHRLENNSFDKSENNTKDESISI